jgi:hypothetical protein
LIWTIIVYNAFNSFKTFYYNLFVNYNLALN